MGRIVLVVVLVALACSVSFAEEPDYGFGKLEMRAYVPIAPDNGIEIGGGIALQLGQVPEDWFVVGALFGNHLAFVDVIYIQGQAAFAGSISLNEAEKDDNLRAWVSIFSEPDLNWSVGLALGTPLNVSDIF